ncbi:CNNM domain-containing protein [Zhongshania aliphaticivorans]|nr:hemolysin family protein [Zhongshania aliphaticivorans]
MTLLASNAAIKFFQHSGISMILLLVYIGIALSVSFLCSVLEAVLLSVTPSYIAAEERRGHKNGVLWREYKTDIDRPLAAILSLNTIAHTVGAAGAGAQATALFGEVYFGVISAVLTLLILIVSEIIPKTLGALYWRKLAPLCAIILRGVMWSMYPLVLMAQGITKLLSHGDSAHSISREEFVALAEVAVSEGILDQEEADAVTSLIRFRSLQARDVMTPRLVIFSLAEDANVKSVVENNKAILFSRIPIYAGDADNITGYIRKDELMLALSREPDALLSTLKRELFVVPDSLPTSELLQNMIEMRAQMALVVNEYGSVMGLVTVEDLIETMLGMQIVDETDTNENMQTLARELWAKRARRLGFLDDEKISAAAGSSPP